MSGTVLSLHTFKKKVKWALVGVILVICMLSTSACLHVEVKEPFESNIKNHQESSYGSLAAFDGTKTVYYYADHDGVPGIYKMDTATSEPEFVVSCNDVKKIQIKDDNLYYLEYELDIRDKRMSTKGYRLMKYNFTRKKAEKVPLYDRWGSHYGTWDFYIGDKGIIFTDLILFASRKTTHDATGIKSRDGEYLKSMRQIGKPKIVKGTDLRLYLYNFGDLFCISIMDWGADESIYVADWGEVGIYDKNQDELVMGNSFTAKIIGQDSGLLLTYGEQLILYDVEKHKILKEYLFENTDRLNNTKVYGDTLIIFGKNKNQNDQILSVDNQTGTINKLFEASEDEHVLYFDQEDYILFDQGEITKNKYSGDEVWTVNLGKIRNTEGYKTDTSGDWLFVTHWNKRKKVRELDAMINMVTGETVEGKGDE